MNKNFFKTFYFYFSLALSLLFIPINLTMETSKGHQSKGLLANGVQFFEQIDKKITDIKFKLSKDNIGHKKVIIVAIDEKSLEKLGRWQSWSREFYGGAIARLDQHGAKVIGFDVVFDSPDDNAGHRFIKELNTQYGKLHKKTNILFKDGLEQALKYSNTDWILENAVKSFSSDNSNDINKAPKKAIVQGYFIQGDLNYKKQSFKDMPKAFRPILRSIVPFRPSKEIPIELQTTVKDIGVNYKKLAKSSHHHGYFSMSPDDDGVVRHYKIFQSLYGNVYPSLALKMIELYWNSPFIVEKIGNTGLLALKSAGKKDFSLPVKSNGQLRVNYYGGQNSFITVSLSDLLNNSPTIDYSYHHSTNAKYTADKNKLFKDSLVLIGATAIGIFDVRNTPKQVNLPGVEIHATVLSQFLDNKFFVELEDLKLLMLILFKALSLLLLGYVIYRTGSFQSLVFLFSIITGFVIWDYYFIFKNNILLFQSPYILAILMLYLILSSFKFFAEEREKLFIKNIFKNYVSADVVTQMINDPQAIKLGGESKEITILFTDIEGFSSISEKLSPAELSKVLNIYLTKMSQCIFKAGGTLDKFIGDAIMCFWGAPIEKEDHAFTACACALEMKKVEKQINKEISQVANVSLRTRFGVNSGESAVGNMGSDDQFAYTALGDHVNLASRLEGVNKTYGTQILISEFTRDVVYEKFLCREVDKVRVVGKEKPVKIFELICSVEEVSDLLSEQIQIFEKGLGFYYEGEFLKASQCFNNSILKHDETAEIFYHRCQQLLKITPQDWEGVWSLTSK